MSKQLQKKYTIEPGAFDSTITREHYTLSGEHPEDRISRDKEYVNRLTTHMNSIVSGLVRSLKLTAQGEEELLSYLFEKTNFDFEEYLQLKKLKYEDLVTSNKWFHNQ
jgi:hypothetical protein